MAHDEAPLFFLVSRSGLANSKLRASGSVCRNFGLVYLSTGQNALQTEQMMGRMESWRQPWHIIGAPYGYPLGVLRVMSANVGVRSGTAGVSKAVYSGCMVRFLRLLAPMILAVLLASAASAADGESALDRIARTGVLPAGTRDDAPPFAFRDAEGRIVGFSVDIIEEVRKALAKHLGRD